MIAVYRDKSGKWSACTASAVLAFRCSTKDEAIDKVASQILNKSRDEIAAMFETPMTAAEFFESWSSAVSLQLQSIDIRIDSFDPEEFKEQAKAAREHIAKIQGELKANDAKLRKLQLRTAYNEKVVAIEAEFQRRMRVALTIGPDSYALQQALREQLKEDYAELDRIREQYETL